MGWYFKTWCNRNIAVHWNEKRILCGEHSQGYFLPFATSRLPDGHQFQQDNYPKHKSMYKLYTDDIHIYLYLYGYMSYCYELMI